jgi:hypothetical protein
MVMGMPSTRVPPERNNFVLEADLAPSFASRAAMTNTLSAAATEPIAKWPILSAKEKGSAIVKAKVDMSAPRFPAKKHRNALPEELQLANSTGTSKSATRMRKQTLAPKHDSRFKNMEIFLAVSPNMNPTTCSYVTAPPN